jgi:hypothetical protein
MSRCTCCLHERTADITKALIAGGSKSEVSGRFGVTESAVQRHRSKCLNLRPRAEKAAAAQTETKPHGPVQFTSDDPKSLVSGTARLVDEALDLLEHAKRADDRRTALVALREARDGLQLLMRVQGLLTNEAASTTIIDQRKQSIQLFSKLSIEELRALASGKPLEPETLDQEALSA